MAEVAKHVRVIGRVQGVFFRAWARDEARSLGVSGWVRNCDDGAVEAHLEGDPEAVGEMIELMREGPPSAEVHDFRVETADPEGLGSFEVRH
jgi:acylphosphatase